LPSNNDVVKTVLDVSVKNGKPVEVRENKKIKNWTFNGALYNVYLLRVSSHLR